MRSLMGFVLGVLGCADNVHSETKFTRPATWESGADNPAQRPRYLVGDRITIRWTTDLDRVSVAVWQSRSQAPYLWAWVDHNLTERFTTWKVDFSNGRFDPATDGEDARFWFTLYDPDDVLERSAEASKSLVNSAAFNVSVSDQTISSSSTTTEEPSALSTTARSDSTKAISSPAQSSDVASSTSSTSSSPSANTMESGSESGLSTGALVGVSVGATAGGLLILAICGLLAWRHFKKRKEPTFLQPPQYQLSSQEQLQSPGVMAELSSYGAPPAYGLQRPAIYEAP
ncbi:hypothetical protein NM208_g13490 [Fusarium decemcellulare]|uniref:Uncharacterized protein n=1 Tax=Fusarium decemcellulare TaxID=57161 RepID=A0ACC1RKV1_9HYPO|nr:hypothetical protein NM208_g13490 [Fusarium decemcellulare]